MSSLLCASFIGIVLIHIDLPRWDYELLPHSDLQRGFDHNIIYLYIKLIYLQIQIYNDNYNSIDNLAATAICSPNIASIAIFMTLLLSYVHNCNLRCTLSHFHAFVATTLYTFIFYCRHHYPQSSSSSINMNCIAVWSLYLLLALLAVGIMDFTSYGLLYDYDWWLQLQLQLQTAKSGRVVGGRVVVG